MRDFKFHDYFDDPKHGSKALARFAVFLGGLGNLGGQAPGSPNRALDGLEENIRADHDQQLAYLNSAKYFADKQGEGVTDLLKQQASDRQQAELDYSNKKLATADKFAELAQTARGKQNYDAAMIEVAKLKKSAYDDQQKVFADISTQSYQDACAKHQLALANRHKGGGGGTGNGAAFTAFTDAAGELKPGDPIPADVIAKALGAGIKRDKIAAQVDAYRNSGTKSEPKGSSAGGTELKDIENAGKPFQSVLVGSARSPGAKLAYDSAAAVKRELENAVKSGDADKIKSAVLHAQEQQTRFFVIGAAPTAELFKNFKMELKGTPAELTAKLSSIVGSPTESSAYVKRLITSIDGIAEQRKAVIEAQRAPLEARLQSIVKSDEGKRRAAGILKELIGRNEGVVFPERAKTRRQPDRDRPRRSSSHRMTRSSARSGECRLSKYKLPNGLILSLDDETGEITVVGGGGRTVAAGTRVGDNGLLGAAPDGERAARSVAPVGPTEGTRATRISASHRPRRLRPGACFVGLPATRTHFPPPPRFRRRRETQAVRRKHRSSRRTR